MLHTGVIRHRLMIYSVMLAGLTALHLGTGVAASTPPLQLKDHTITIDATNLVPTSWWQVPGFTPSIWASDPESLDAPKTSERRELLLKSGKYKFVSFTFDFPFTVTRDGTLEFSPSLDQCIEGRGTTTLTVRCKRMYPHGGQPDPYYEHTP